MGKPQIVQTAKGFEIQDEWGEKVVFRRYKDKEDGDRVEIYNVSRNPAVNDYLEDNDVLVDVPVSVIETIMNGLKEEAK